MAPPARRLFIGSGVGGMGVQCGVDVGFIVDNIYVSRHVFVFFGGVGGRM